MKTMNIMTTIIIPYFPGGFPAYAGSYEFHTE
jgi:hypothetical protein